MQYQKTGIKLFNYVKNYLKIYNIIKHDYKNHIET